MPSNNIAFARNYTSVIDEVYQRASISGVLNSGRRMVRAGHNAKEILIPKISVTGLGNYTRNVGYKTGAITYEFETKTFNYDRGIRLFADVMDVEEAGVELQRTQVAPEADASPVPHERDVRCRHGDVYVPEPELPVLQLHEPCQRERPGEPLGRAVDALHVLVLRVHDHRLPGLRPVDAHRPVLHVLGMLAPDDDLCGRDLGAAFERHHGLSVLLQLRKPRGRQRHGVGKQQDGVHGLPHRHGEHAGVSDSGITVADRYVLCPPLAVKLLCSTKLSLRGGHGRFVCSSGADLPDMWMYGIRIRDAGFWSRLY